MRSRTYLIILLLFIATTQASLLGQVSPPGASIDLEHSTMTVHVYRSGLFSFAGDNHEIRAAITSGVLNETTRSVELGVDVRRMRVLDPNLSPDKRAQEQEKMLSPDVLDPDRFPKIEFRSTRVEEKNGNNLSVSGNLTLHGQTRPINVIVVRTQSHYRGSATIKQTDFAIKPISIGGGTIKVKDEVRVDFDIVTPRP